MGRKKRPNSTIQLPPHPQVPPGFPPVTPAAPIPVPMLGGAIHPAAAAVLPVAPPPSFEPPDKKVKIESYPVKKYRMIKTLRAIESFQRYTKAHRMTDATFVSFPHGGTQDKPIVFSCRIGGQDLSWGRGKTRDEAIDNACRAAFALVNAHGYQDFDLNEDCFVEEPKPVITLPPPPPPPPPPHMMGMVPGMMISGLPPAPIGLPPVPPPVPMSEQQAVLLNGAQRMDEQRPEPTSLMGKNMNLNGIALSGSRKEDVKASTTVVTSSTGVVTSPWKKTIKGGLTLVYDGEEDNGNDMIMEERRARIKYYASEHDFMKKRRMELQS